MHQAFAGNVIEMLGSVLYDFIRIRQGDFPFMKITKLFSDVITENIEYEFKAVLNSKNPVT